MNKIRNWPTRVVPMLVALALVLSLAGVSLLPVMASECRAFLVANITAPANNATISSGQEFDLTFSIKNTGNCTATNVMGLVTVSAGAHVVAQAAGIPSLAENATANFTATLQCDEVGYTVIHVDPVGHDSCLDAEIDESCTTSSIIGIQQVFSLDCEAEPNPTKVCHNVTFTGTIGTGAVYSVAWNWTFGDGNSAAGSTNSSTFTTTHCYNASGSYTPLLSVTDSTTPTPVTVTCNATGVIAVYDTLGVNCGIVSGNHTYEGRNMTKVNQEVCFNATQVDGIPVLPDGYSYSWAWDFGDGVGTSNLQSPCYNYTSADNYTAIVTLSDDYLDNEATCNVTLEVYPELGVSCNATPTHTKVGDEVTFNATATGGFPVPPASYTWDWTFPSGTPPSATTQGATVTFNTGGNHTATVILYDNTALNNTATCNVTVQIEPALNVTCSAVGNTVCNAVQFYATASGGLGSYNYTWDFGDPVHSTTSNPNTSTDQNPTHTYMCAGTYTYIITVADSELGNTANCTAQVEVIIEAPELESPPNGSQLTSKNVTFEWEDIGCCNYTLEVWQKDADVRLWYEETGHDNQWSGCVPNGNWRWFVTATDACGNNATSDTWIFQMSQPDVAIIVQGPNGGETLACNYTKVITWTATPIYATIEIRYSSDGGGTWTQVASGEANDGAYPWTVPCINSEQCLVRLIARDACQGEGADTSDGVFTITTEPAPVTTIDLAAGWNLISLPLIPTNSTAEAVLADVIDDVIIVRYYDAETETWPWYIPGNPASTLPTIDDGLGYWVSMNATGTITVTGKEVPDPPALPPTYDVFEGWNLIGFKSTIPLSHSVYLGNLWAGGLPNYSIIWGYDVSVPAYTLVYAYPSGGTDTMEPGHGYWLWATAAGIIVPP